MISLLKIINSAGLIQPGINLISDLLCGGFRGALSNISKDLSLKKSSTGIGQKICIAGLPKSGTTLIEEILRFNNYLDLNHTSIRRSPRFGISEPENELPWSLFKYCRISDYVFVKTHIRASCRNLDIISSGKVELIVMIRDLRDMMISRYFHIVNSPRHRQHHSLVGLTQEEGLFRSMTDSLDGIVPLEYFAGWIEGWLDSAPDRIIRHEQFLADVENYIRVITTRLAVKKSISENVQHIQEHNNNLKSRTLRQNLGLWGRQRSTFRNTGPRGWKNILSPSLKKVFKQKAQSCLTRSGYETDANW